MMLCAIGPYSLRNIVSFRNPTFYGSRSHIYGRITYSVLYNSLDPPTPYTTLRFTPAYHHPYTITPISVSRPPVFSPCVTLWFGLFGP